VQGGRDAGRIRFRFPFRESETEKKVPTCSPSKDLLAVFPRPRLRLPNWDNAKEVGLISEIHPDSSGSEGTPNLPENAGIPKDRDCKWT